MILRSPVYGAVAALLACAASGRAAEAPPRVEFAGGKLSVEAERAPLAEIVAAIEARADVKIRIPDAAKALPVTTKFRDLPLEQGMKEILRQLSLESHAVVYEKPGGRAIAFVVVESKKGTAPDDSPPSEFDYPDTDPRGVPLSPGTLPAKPPAPITAPDGTPPKAIPTVRAPSYVPPSREPRYAPPASDPQPTGD